MFWLTICYSSSCLIVPRQTIGHIATAHSWRPCCRRGSHSRNWGPGVLPPEIFIDSILLYMSFSAIERQKTRLFWRVGVLTWPIKFKCKISYISYDGHQKKPDLPNSHSPSTQSTLLQEKVFQRVGKRFFNGSVFPNPLRVFQKTIRR